MRVMVGCPVFKREWILPHWFEAVEAAFAQANLEPEYVFVLTAGDDPTIKSVYQNAGKLITTLVEQDRTHGGREWGPVRYHEMVSLRNTLLGLVRDESPDFFFSLDSDILIQRNLLVNLLESSERFDAVGGLAHMVAHKAHKIPSWGTLEASGNLIRKDSEGVHLAGVIMALKLMKPQAYRVDYRFHEHGEDIGWCIACQENGLKLGFDGRLTNKHVMDPEALNEIDPRCGY